MKRIFAIFAVASLCLVLSACKTPDDESVAPTETVAEPDSRPESAPVKKVEDGKGFSTTPAQLAPDGAGIATFAGGCFWCMEHPFEAIPGVTAVYSGYTGGAEDHPKYQDVGRGKTSHTEAVRVVYDKDKVSYQLLLDVFWRNINPTQVDGQFVDHGKHYRTGIYPHDAEQRKLAEASKAKIGAKFEAAIAVEIVDAGAFWPAEDYHQDFYIVSPAHYERYRSGSGRDAYLKKVWGEEAGGYSLHAGEKK